jgi:hypothetical protein
MHFLALFFRQELLKWNGWGYQDSKFVVENGIVSFTGNRYVIAFRGVNSCLLIEKA